MTNSRPLKSFIAAAAVVVGVATTAAPVAAHDSGENHSHSGSSSYQANLTQLNDSGTSGTATVKVEGDQVTATLNTEGASASLPHAQHIHIGGQGVCPDMSADSNGSGFISTVEGQPSYGEVKVSLTTEGDVSAESGLAVDRFPTADEEGMVSYSRTFSLPEGVSADDLENAVVVQHGISTLYGDNAQYDGDPRSSLDDSLPFEATAPSACGVLSATPQGGVDAGNGTTSGIERSGFLALGAAALIGAGAVALSRRRHAVTE